MIKSISRAVLREVQCSVPWYQKFRTHEAGQQGLSETMLLQNSVAEMQYKQRLHAYTVQDKNGYYILIQFKIRLSVPLVTQPHNQVHIVFLLKSKTCLTVYQLQLFLTAVGTIQQNTMNRNNRSCPPVHILHTKEYI